MGSNIPSRRQWLLAAEQLISRYCGIITARSSLYETAAWGLEDQADFLNRAIKVMTELTPESLLSAIRAIELELGRQRKIKWGARTLDVDILFYDEAMIAMPDLSVPHPRIPERRFALVPMAEIAPLLVHPLLQLTVKELLAICPDTLPVRKVAEKKDFPKGSSGD